MKKNKYIKFRVSIEDKAEIKKLSETLGYDSISDYLSSIALSGMTHKDRILAFQEVDSLRKRNAMVENNINQIAKYVNTYKVIDKDRYDEYVKLFRSFITARYEQNLHLEEFYKRISDLKK
ncbi:hypothetical protein [uncultured Christiangramia sp.]|uniref:plasmid mobilization protein n=1 Tax=Christiangramia sp. 3-2217-3z TaxID=3417564 RepID=UPI002626DCE7|nr:hypothetical protein [uncultured Christiangramia sp.]